MTAFGLRFGADRWLAIASALLLGSCSSSGLMTNEASLPPAEPPPVIASAPTTPVTSASIPAPDPAPSTDAIATPPNRPAGAQPRGTPNMAGRWHLTSPEVGGSCIMTFNSQGGVAPEGGCPGDFFTSRRWTFEQGALIIRDQRGQAIARLTPAAAGQFDGQSSTSQAITLAK